MIDSLSVLGHSLFWVIREHGRPHSVLKRLFARVTQAIPPWPWVLAMLLCHCPGCLPVLPQARGGNQSVGSWAAGQVIPHGLALPHLEGGGMLSWARAPPWGTPMEGCVAFPVPPAPSPRFTDAWANTRGLLSTFRFLLSSSTSLCFWGHCQLLYWNTLPQQFRGWFLVFGQNPHEEKVPRLPFSPEKQQQFLCKINFR